MTEVEETKPVWTYGHEYPTQLQKIQTFNKFQEIKQRKESSDNS